MHPKSAITFVGVVAGVISLPKIATRAPAFSKVFHSLVQNMLIEMHEDVSAKSGRLALAGLWVPHQHRSQFKGDSVLANICIVAPFDSGDMQAKNVVATTNS